MVKLSAEALKQELPGFGLYVVVGLVVFTAVRVAVSAYGLAGWQMTLVALGVMFVVLEALTALGWLTKPFSETVAED